MVPAVAPGAGLGLQLMPLVQFPFVELTQAALAAKAERAEEARVITEIAAWRRKGFERVFICVGIFWVAN